MDKPAVSTIPQTYEPMQNQHVIAELNVAHRCLDWALSVTGMTSQIKIRFSARLKTSMGNARTFWGQNRGVVQLNKNIWLRATPEKRRNTILHEIAHILANLEAGRCRGHGDGWKRMMRRLDETPSRCHEVDVQGHTRRQARAIVTATVSDFKIGDKVRFGLPRGEKTLGEVIGFSGTRLRVVQFGKRGRTNIRRAGTTWKVPVEFAEKV